jgi:hypothetical protein
MPIIAAKRAILNVGILSDGGILVVVVCCDGAITSAEVGVDVVSIREGVVVMVGVAAGVVVGGAVGVVVVGSVIGVVVDEGVVSGGASTKPLITA